jgi:endonuclease VIII
MPEGDTIFRAARTLHRALAGRVVTSFESVYPALTRVDAQRPLTGRTIAEVSARGKHVLIAFSGDLVLRTHMRMHGSWHLYRPGERWRQPSRDMRVMIGTDAFVAVGFRVPEAEFIERRLLSRHRQLRQLGPDLMDPSFNRDDVIRRIRTCGPATIADVLLNQRVLAGIGNVFKSEILFAAGVNPFATAADLDNETLDRILIIAVRQLRSNVSLQHRRLTPASGRRTTGSLHPSKGLWVYGRVGEPCRTCGQPIVLDKGGRDARLTYWCPRCQGTSSEKS